MTAPSPEQIQMLNEQSIVHLFGYDINFYALIIGIVFVAFLYGVYRANRNPQVEFDWVDLVTATDQATGKIKASGTKIAQLLGVITGTFIVVKLTLQNNISFDIFATYLAYVASIDGFSKYILARYGVKGGDTPPAPPVLASPPASPPASDPTPDATPAAKPKDD